MRACFVTPELAPYTPGGAGGAVAELAGRLTRAGHDVTVFVVGPSEVETEEPFAIVWAPVASDAGDPFRARSERAAELLKRSDRRFDFVEFVDFDALAYDALIDRHAAGIEDTRTVVRVHGPADLMFEAVGLTPPELVSVIAREREIYRMADVVVAPSAALRDLVIRRYGLEIDRVLVGPPAMAPLDVGPRMPAARPEVVCFGRLAEVKGSHDLLREMLPVLERRSDVTLRFVGNDGWSAEAGTGMRAWLEKQIPTDLRERIRFDGAVPRSELAASLAPAWVVVIPSRFESYCLAADEVRLLGHPLIVRDLPAFRDRMNSDVGAWVVPTKDDGSLGRAIERVIDDVALREQLSSAPPPTQRDPLEPYSSLLPPVRHVRSQAGLATAAVQRVEQAMPAAAQSALSGRVAAAAKAMLGVLPDPLARLAVRLLPQRLKDRFRAVASWPEEAERRRRGGIRNEVLSEIAAGRYPELDDPAVSIVIPCFNQGAYLDDAILSVFRQTDRDWEIVVVDDGSDDPGTIAAFENLEWPRVSVIHRENGGLPAARNTGIGAARGRFVVPLDADDELAPDYLEVMIAALESDPRAAYAHCWAELFGDRNEVWVSRPFNEYQMLVSNSVIGCVVLRRSAWESVGGYDESMVHGNEDWELWVRLLEAGWGQVEVPRPLFRYRKHGVSMSVETEARFEEGRRQVIDRHRHLYEDEELRRRKRLHYPLVSVIGDLQGIPAGADVQLVNGEAGRAALRQSRGKYVLCSDGTLDYREVEEAARWLENHPGLAAVRCGNTNLWRRWALLDGEAPLERVHDLEDRDPMTALQLDDWAVSAIARLDGVPVARQQVETAGFLDREML